MLREQAWIPTPLGDKFSLHFDDTKYLELIAEHFAQEVASFSCETFYHAGALKDPVADAYADGYNSAVEQIVEHIRKRYVASNG